MKKYLLIVLLFFVSSCKLTRTILFRAMGVKAQKEKTDKQVLAFINKKNIDYDYIIRAKSPYDFKPLFDSVAKKLNGVNICDNEGNIYLEENKDSNICHKVLRYKLIEDSGIIHKSNVRVIKNIKEKLIAHTICINAKKNLFDNQIKKSIVLIGVATFLPTKNKRLTELGYIKDIQDAHLRDRVTIVLFDFDLIPEHNE